MSVRAMAGVTWAALTHPGRVRPNNEDGYRLLTCSQSEYHILPHEGEIPPGGGEMVIAVSDGMGGANLGQRASSMILERIGDTIPRTYLVDAKKIAEGRGDLLETIIRDVHEQINHEAETYAECKGMGATASTLWIHPGTASFAHVGDSRIYLHSGGQTQQLSEDHTTVGRLVRTGAISPLQAKLHPLRNVLSQAVGAGINRIHPQVGDLETESGDIFLVCSDGLTEGLSDNAIAVVLSAIARGEIDILEARDTLFRESMAGSGRDNITLVLAQVG